MPALKEDVKLFVVTALACFDAPEQVIAAVKQEYGLDVSKQQLGSYNPKTIAGRRLSAKLKAVFDETRKNFLTKIEEIPIANQSFRMRALQRLLAKVEGQGNVVVAAQLLEQAAKEAGGAFTNQRHVNANVKASVTQNTDPQDLTDEELAAVIAAGSGSAGTADKA